MSNIENKNVSKDVIYDENNGLYYTKIGDYYYPNIVLDNTEKVTLSKYGRARLRYLKEYNKGLYTELLMTGKLTEHLKGIFGSGLGIISLHQCICSRLCQNFLSRFLQ